MSLPIRQQIETDVDWAFVEFGLTEEQFLLQTPRQWQRRVEYWKQREARKDKRVARIATVLAWCHGATDVNEDDFMPVAVQEEEYQTGAEVLAIIETFSNSRKSNGN